MRQAQFLAFLTAEAARSPAFELVLRADVRELVEADGLVRARSPHPVNGYPLGFRRQVSR